MSPEGRINREWIFGKTEAIKVKVAPWNACASRQMVETVTAVTPPPPLTLLWCSRGGCRQANQLAGEVVGTAFSDKGCCFQGLWSSRNYLARPHASRQPVSVRHPLAAGGVQLSRGPLEGGPVWPGKTRIFSTTSRWQIPTPPQVH